MPVCLKCKCEFRTGDGGDCVASITGGIMGDEYTDTYFLCPTCDLYTVEIWREPFLNEDRISFRGPVSREDGDPTVALIRQCPQPWDKTCRCEAHTQYFGEMLD